MVQADPGENEDAITEEKLFWFLATAYVLRVVGLLRPDKEDKLNSLSTGWEDNWQDHVRTQLGINDTFIRNLYGLCSEFKTAVQAVSFILRGFGCPSTDARLSEFTELNESD